MSSQWMMGFAALLLVCAAGLGYWGLSMSQGTGPSSDLRPATGQDIISDSTEVSTIVPSSGSESLANTRVDVVVLARDVSAHREITPEDLFIERLRTAPPGSFENPEVLVGRKVWRNLPEGSVLDTASFDHGGPLARMIGPSERALTIQIDDISGGGGHLRPGDYVDVLLFLRQDNINTDQTVQVVVPAVRILGVGSELGLDTTGKPVALSAGSDESLSRASRPESARNAVVAVPAEILTRFALAAQVGNLRLAVRSAAENHLLEYYKAGVPIVEDLNEQLYQFEKLSLRQAQRPQPGLVTRPRSVEIIRGQTVSTDSP